MKKTTNTRILDLRKFPKSVRQVINTKRNEMNQIGPVHHWTSASSCTKRRHENECDLNLCTLCVEAAQIRPAMTTPRKPKNVREICGNDP